MPLSGSSPSALDRRWCAIHLAAEAPTRIIRLILEDPVIVLESQLAEFRSRMTQLLALKHQPLEVVFAALAEQTPRMDHRWVEQSARSLINTADGPFRALVEGGEQRLVDWHDLLGRLSMPVLVLAADPVLGAWFAGETRRVFEAAVKASARVIDFPGCGHHIEAECADLFVQAVEDFLL